MSEEKPRIVVVGAGVIGLTNALILARKGKYDITIVGKHMPGDLNIEYASPWAGANYMPFSAPDTVVANWERDTWPEVERLAREQLEAGIHFLDVVLYGRNKDTSGGGAGNELQKHAVAEGGAWFKTFVPHYRTLQGEELHGHDFGVRYGSACFNVNIYLHWLLSQCLGLGVTVKRGVFKHISEAADSHNSGSKADLIVNCTGLSSLRLGGVEDKALYPVRGQTVLIRNSPKTMYSTTGTDDGKDELMYIMERAGGGGTILGGCYQEHTWNSEVDPNMATRIMRRAVDIAPELTGGKGIEHLDVIRHNVGYRPAREGGPRVEVEKIDGMKIVHCYGHGGYGYQTSYGCAATVLDLVEGQL